MNVQCDFIHYADSVRPSVTAAIETHIRELFKDLSPDVRGAIIQSVVGGKCVRGSLLCLVGEAFGGRLQDMLSHAVAIECIHAATLVHDDLIDNDRCRRGQPALWTLAGGREAVLLGDVILADAIRTLARLGAAEARIGGDTISKLALGAYAESRSGGPPSTRAYQRIIELKTGVLFSAAAELGAVCAQVTPELHEHVRRFGHLIGEAYQIADDLQALDHETLSSSFLPVIWHFFPDWRERAVDLSTEKKERLRRRMLDTAIARCEEAVLSLTDAPIIRFANALRMAPRQTAGMQCQEISPPGGALPAFGR